MLTHPQTSGAQKDLWQTRVEGMLKRVTIFFANGTIMYEGACEPNGNCNTDQLSFKAYLSRWMAATAKVAPWTHDIIMPLLQTSAEAAAKACSGGDGTVCGTKWTTGSYDGTTGVGQQMSAMEVIQSNLIDTVSGPVSKGNGGISKGNAAAGTGGDNPDPLKPIATSDRAGAGITTALILVFILGGAWYVDESPFFLRDCPFLLVLIRTAVSAWRILRKRLSTLSSSALQDRLLIRYLNRWLVS